MPIENRSKTPIAVGGSFRTLKREPSAPSAYLRVWHHLDACPFGGQLWSSRVFRSRRFFCRRDSWKLLLLWHRDQPDSPDAIVCSLAIISQRVCNMRRRQECVRTPASQTKIVGLPPAGITQPAALRGVLPYQCCLRLGLQMKGRSCIVLGMAVTKATWLAHAKPGARSRLIFRLRPLFRLRRTVVVGGTR
jgi:hypothetical protein